jgi:hypothetical protein
VSLPAVWSADSCGRQRAQSVSQMIAYRLNVSPNVTHFAQFAPIHVYLNPPFAKLSRHSRTHLVPALSKWNGMARSLNFNAVRFSSM